MLKESNSSSRYRYFERGNLSMAASDTSTWLRPPCHEDPKVCMPNKCDQVVYFEETTLSPQDLHQQSSDQTATGCEVGSSSMSRKVHKADREKLRRDKLNEQFAELASVLDSEKPKHDKASILGESLQAVKDLRTEIQRLKIERGTLFDESRDLRREKDDLEDEKATLKKQTDELEAQLQQYLQAALSFLGNGPFEQTVRPSTPPVSRAPSAPSQAHSSIAYSPYAPGFQFPPHIPGVFSNPFVYVPPPSASHVERPCAQYPSVGAVPDFLNKVQSNRGFQPLVYRPQPIAPEKPLWCSSDPDDSDVQLHLGQPRPQGDDEAHGVDTDLQLKVCVSEPAAVAHASS